MKNRIKDIFKYMISDSLYLKIRYYRVFHMRLDLSSPKTFNEKMQWLKINDRNPLYTKLVDKYEVRKYVKERIGEKYLIPLYGVWDRFDDIDFSQLPEKFVIKCTHDSGGVRICKDILHFDVEESKKFLCKRMRHNFYYDGREWPYKNVKSRIIVEQLLENNIGDVPDYKFMCFNGKVECCFTCTERFSKEGLKVTFFDRDWNVLPFERHFPKSDVNINKPNMLSEMIRLAERLAKNIPFVRVDFYEVENKIYFGEMTFYPGSGFEEFKPDEFDLILGNKINIDHIIGSYR